MRYLTSWPRAQFSKDLFRQFDDFFEGVNETTPAELRTFSPTMDVEETKDAYLVRFDIPGIKDEELKIEVKDNTLFVSGERKREEKTNGEYVRYERFYGRFERALTLPRNVDADKIDAQYDKGVLTLAVPKIATATTKTIEVRKR